MREMQEYGRVEDCRIERIGRGENGRNEKIWKRSGRDQKEHR